jgi:hypothetical protein
MSSLTAASYLPDRMVIILKPEFDAYADIENPKGFTTPETLGFFFHEWTHYLHNVSTIQGISAFANVVRLWSVFRNSIDVNTGLSMGSAALAPYLNLSAKQIQRYLLASRAPKSNELPLAVSIDDISFSSVRLRTEKIEGSDFDVTTIVCLAEIAGGDVPTKEIVLEIGTHEILESLASMLERKIVRAFGGVNIATPIVPYHLVEILAHFNSPQISDDAIIGCMLCSLQSSDPPHILLDAFKCEKVAQEAGRDPLRELATISKESLKNTKFWVKETLKQIEDTFPVDEAMGRAVKKIVNTIRNNLFERQSNPFFEFDILNKVKNNLQYMDEAVRRYGLCTIVQERPGPLDQIQRDFMLDIAVFGPVDYAMQEGWRKMHASFRFVALHSSQDGFMSTETMQRVKPLNFKMCPFFTACNLSLRKEKPEVCVSAPWKSIDENDLSKGSCYYQAAMISIGPAPKTE